MATIKQENFEKYWKSKNYVNLYYQNYLRYYSAGQQSDKMFHVSADENHIYNILKSYRTRTIAKLRKSVKAPNKRVIQKLEKQFNFFYNVKIRKNSMQEQVWNQIIDQAINILNQQRASKGKSPLVITDDTYDHLVVASVKSDLGADTKTKIKGFVINCYNFVSTIQRTIDTIMKHKDTIITSNLSYNGHSIDAKRLQMLVTEWEKFKKKVEQDKSRLIGKNIPVYTNKNYYNHKEDMIGSIGYTDFALEINYIYSNIFANNSYWSGMLAEIIVGIIGNAIANGINLTEKNIDINLQKLSNKKILSKTVIGDQVSNKAYNTNLFGDGLFNTKDIWQEILSSTDYRYSAGAGVAWSNHPSQNKVDITFSVGDINIKGSVKNYNLNGAHIGLVSGARTLMLVQNEQEFLKHYLNITQQHPEPPSDDIRTYSLKAQYFDAENQLLQMAHQSMKLILAEKALVGGTLSANLGKKGGLSLSNSLQQTDTANLMILHDNSLGRFYLLDVSELLAAVNNSLLTTNSGVTIHNYPEDDEYYKLSGDWGARVGPLSQDPNLSGKKRIAQLYKILHNQKIKVSVSTQVVKNYIMSRT